MSADQKATPSVTAFDLPLYQAITEARASWLASVLDEIRVPIRTALDVGCGSGDFSRILMDRGLVVTGVDLQPENIAVCRARYPHATFQVADVDAGAKLGLHDLSLVFGLLYHLQNPVTAIAQIARATGRIAIIETRVAAGSEAKLSLFRELDGAEHSTASVAAVPTLPALVALLQLAGLRQVYIPEAQPAHAEWNGMPWTNGRRIALVASREELGVPWPKVGGRIPAKWQSSGLVGTVERFARRLLRK